MNIKLKSFLLFPFNLLYRVNPRLELSLLYHLKRKKKLNLHEPKTYLEKLNWLKLYYRDDLMPFCADKYLVRSYIAEKGYAHLLPKLLWEGVDPSEIPFEQLPDSFVIKSTSGSGNNIICKNKAELNHRKTIKILKKCLRQKYLPCYGEWHYSHIKPRIIIEEFLSDGLNYVPVDYKFFCFNGLENGKTGCIAVDTGRYIDHRRNIYDPDFNFMSDISFGFATDDTGRVLRPAFLEEMKDIAHKLAKPFPHVRVDFLVLKDKFYIGELTFFNGAGFDPISPEEYDLQMGNWIILPESEHRQ